MAVLTWPRLIEAARQGDHELLCRTLETLDGRSLTRAHHRDLANLIRDMRKIKLKRNRPKLSAETLALSDPRYLHVRLVSDWLKQKARWRGKTHLRGAARKAALQDVLQK